MSEKHQKLVEQVQGSLSNLERATREVAEAGQQVEAKDEEIHKFKENIEIWQRNYNAVVQKHKPVIEALESAKAHFRNYA
jgi:trans-aconitate methyltransferase